MLRDRLLQLLLRARVAGALRKFLHVGLHVLFLLRELLRRANGVGDILRRTARLLLIKQSTRFLEIVERLRGVAGFCSVRGGTTHRVGGVLQSARSVGQ